jgi:hypothetical protein
MVFIEESKLGRLIVIFAKEFGSRSKRSRFRNQQLHA